MAASSAGAASGITAGGMAPAAAFAPIRALVACPDKGLFVASPVDWPVAGASAAPAHRDRGADQALTCNATVKRTF